MIIGLTGKKRRGKDTVAAHLVANHDFKRYGFADKVKAYAYAQNPVVDTPWVRLQNVVDVMGWEQAKEIPEVRGLLQRTGTEAGRSVFWKDFWVDILFRQLEEEYMAYNTGLDERRLQTSKGIVISDVRFDNEAERIMQYGGHVIRVVSSREGLPAPDEHASEKDIASHLISGTIHNNGSFEELYKSIDEMLKTLK
jgi:hypothetical protein